MKRLLITAGRIRSVVAGVMTEKDLEISLRMHRIPYAYDTSRGYLAIRIPARSGPVLVVRTSSRSAPFQVRSAAPVPFTAAAPLLRLHD